MKKKKTWAVLPLAAFFLLLPAVSLNAATPDTLFYHVVTCVSDNPSSAVTVNYHCPDPGSLVMYTKASDISFEKAGKAEPVCEEWSSRGLEKTSRTSTFYTRKRFVCHANITGLEPDTEYIYKIVSGKGESKVFSFKTAGKKGRWNFVAFTDLQYRENEITPLLVRNMKEIGKSPALVVCSGDMVDVSGNEYEWDWILDNEAFSGFVYAAAPGDHEYWADDSGRKYPQYDRPYTFNKLFKFPANGAAQSPNSTYFFHWNNVLFVVLDMNNSNTASGPRFDDQAEWFAKTLDSLEGSYKYLIVMMHKSIFGSSVIDSVVAKKLRPQWSPLFSKYNVDLVLSGHDHIYSRTCQLDGGKETTDRKKGTYYLDMGSSGDKRRVPDKSLVEGDGLHQKVINLKELDQSCACNIEVSRRKMKVTVYDKDRKIADSFVIKAKR